MSQQFVLSAAPTHPLYPPTPRPIRHSCLLSFLVLQGMRPRWPGEAGWRKQGAKKQQRSLVVAEPESEPEQRPGKSWVQAVLAEAAIPAALSFYYIAGINVSVLRTTYSYAHTQTQQTHTHTETHEICRPYRC